jgi:hypothetical protein
MEVLRVEGDATTVTVTTTGGIFRIERRSILLSRRIDPAINGVNPRPVSRLDFNTPLGPLAVRSASRREVLLTARPLQILIRCDSLAVLQHEAGGVEPLSYRYSSLLADPPWLKGNGADRMWTDGYGGSLHLSVPGTALRVSNSAPEGMDVTLPPGGSSAASVFPPKRFDFERLYGLSARPHCYFTYRVRSLAQDVARLDALAQRHFGVICLFAGFYSNDPQYGGPRASLPERNAAGRLQYRFGEEAVVQRFIDAARSRGFKVIAYFQGTGFRVDRQPLEETLAFMRAFQRHHRLDGWYFDNADVGPWTATYEFIRRVRRDVGDSGILFHHDSVDVWGGWSGQVMVQVDAYVDYTLKGETGQLAETHSPNDPYFRFYTAGYGISQALASHKILSKGRAAITLAETFRLLGENLHGSPRISAWMLPEWDRSYLPHYEARKREYLRGTLRPDVRWPVEWFREISGVQVEWPGPGQAVLRWRTPEPAWSELRLTTSRYPDFRERPPIRDRAATRRHALVLTGLAPATEFRYAIRCYPAGGRADDTVWGRTGSFRTPGPK